MSIAILAIPTFLTIMYLPPALALVQNSVRPSQRTMSGALLLMVLNIIGLGGGPTMVGVLSDQFAGQAAASGLDGPAASAQGLQTALYWVTPFYLVAVGFILLQARAVAREIKTGGMVRDGGFRFGLVLALVGLTGLYLRYQGLGFPGAVLNIDRLSQFGTFDLVGQIDAVMETFTSIVMTIFSVWGLWLLGSSLTRKPAPASA
jgi:hypothetical protein